MTAHSTSSTPPGEDDLDSGLLERYWLGETSPEETAAVDRWFTSHPQWFVRYEQLRRGLKAGHWTAWSDADVSRSVARALESTGIDRERDTVKTPAIGTFVHRGSGKTVLGNGISAPPRLRRAMWFSGSSVVLGIALAFIGWRGGIFHPARPVTSVSTYTTSAGQRANIALPDGSTVTLGVASRLDVPANFGTEHRAVQLTGEALFTVPHRTRVPFTVTVAGTAVRVLGTSFVVRNYVTDSATLVAVREGKVAVRSAVVAAQQQIEVRRGSVGPVQRADPAQFSFAAGLLTLTHVPFPAAIQELNRWYDTDIRIADPTLSAQRITATLPAGSLTDLTAILEATYHVRVVRNGRVLTLFPQ